MLPDRTRYLGAFTFSCALHLLAAVIVVFLFVTTRDATRIAPAIITLLPMAPPERSAPEKAPLFVMPLPESPRPPPVREPRAEDRTVVSRPTAEPKPASVKPTRAAMKPSSSSSVSYAEFQQRHGGPKAPASPRVPVPRISEKFDMTAGTTESRGAGAEVAEQTFAEGLLFDLREAFAAEGLFPPGLGADVEFSIKADGAITGLRVVMSSGDRNFDAAVLRAFRRVRVRGFSKSEVGHPFAIHFKVGRK